MVETAEQEETASWDPLIQGVWRLVGRGADRKGRKVLRRHFDVRAGSEIAYEGMTPRIHCNVGGASAAADISTLGGNDIVGLLPFCDVAGEAAY